MCCAGRTHCTIDFDSGQIYACSHDPKSYGNIYTDGLKDAWDRMSDWRDMTYLPEECRNCRMLSVCSGLCRMQVNRPMKIRLKPYTEYHPDVPVRSAVPPEDVLYIISPQIRMRPENFGGIVLTDENKYVSVMPGTYALIQYLMKIGDFCFSDLKDVIEMDDNFYGVVNELIKSHIIIRSDKDRTD